MENAKFLALFDQSRAPKKAAFAKKAVFENYIKVVYYDTRILNFYTRLTNFYSQFRVVGTIYNQVVKILYRHFSERKAAAYLYRLEKGMAELAKLFKEVTEKRQELEGNHIAKREISAMNNGDNSKKQSQKQGFYTPKNSILQNCFLTKNSSCHL